MGCHQNDRSKWRDFWLAERWDTLNNSQLVLIVIFMNDHFSIKVWCPHYHFNLWWTAPVLASINIARIIISRGSKVKRTIRWCCVYSLVAFVVLPVQRLDVHFTWSKLNCNLNRTESMRSVISTIITVCLMHLSRFTRREVSEVYGMDMEALFLELLLALLFKSAHSHCRRICCENTT